MVWTQSKGCSEAFCLSGDACGHSRQASVGGDRAPLDWPGRSLAPTVSGALLTTSLVQVEVSGSYRRNVASVVACAHFNSILTGLKLIRGNRQSHSNDRVAFLCEVVH
jgi:hypothetical protein